MESPPSRRASSLWHLVTFVRRYVRCTVEDFECGLSLGFLILLEQLRECLGLFLDLGFGRLRHRETCIAKSDKKVSGVSEAELCACDAGGHHSGSILIGGLLEG